jgi:hypothetical protein
MGGPVAHPNSVTAARNKIIKLKKIVLFISSNHEK